jgi:hypothetical protein
MPDKHPLRLDRTLIEFRLLYLRVTWIAVTQACLAKYYSIERGSKETHRKAPPKRAKSPRSCRNCQVWGRLISLQWDLWHTVPSRFWSSGMRDMRERMVLLFCVLRLAMLRRTTIKTSMCSSCPP